ncbi:MAG TPA: hypothetical protein VIY73_16495, partial [Polyangiaceae bacterium]
GRGRPRRPRAYVTEWGTEELRDAVLRGLGEHADGRARDALVHGTLAFAQGVARWDASAGPVEAHDVVLAVDAATLGALRAVPHLADALVAAFAAAIATRRGEALRDLSFRWAPPAATPTGYRDGPPPPRADVLRDALADYLAATGDTALASDARTFVVDDADPELLTLVASPGVRSSLVRDAASIDALTRAARDLLGDARRRVRVR